VDEKGDTHKLRALTINGIKFPPRGYYRRCGNYKKRAIHIRDHPTCTTVHTLVNLVMHDGPPRAGALALSTENRCVC
jgi:hypothetical protein